MTPDQKPTPEQMRRLAEFDDTERILNMRLKELHERRREYISANQLNGIADDADGAQADPTNWDESRIDIIGQNGNGGEHYGDEMQFGHMLTENKREKSN